MRLDDVLSILVNYGADPMIVRPATSKDIYLCNEDLAECEMNHKLPDGYAAFLRELNGFAWNGIEFFSTYQVTDPETDYMLNDIVSANEDFRSYSDDEDDECFLLGRADEDLYVYNPKNRRYEVLDLTGRDVMEKFDTFEEMFVRVVCSRISSRDDCCRKFSL
ncbi:MAG: YrhA family protein [Clostridiales bacterium]|nr:YrhA family protein [Clostridiales bacterium]